MRWKELYDMKHLKTAGLCLLSMLVLGITLAGNASGAPLWLLCLEGSGLTKYSSNQCTEASSTGKWQSSALPSGGSATVRLLAFSLRMTESGVRGTSIYCPDAGVGWGLIEEKKLIIKVAEIRNPEAEGCRVSSELEILKCKAGKLEALQAVRLPWTVEMFETEKKILTHTEGTGGRPGWEIKCGGETDDCEESAEKPESTELLSGVTKGVLLVLARFENKGRANCEIGGKESEQISGLIAILLWNGNGLSITSV
ncbi:MAG: hypothetical protein ACRDLF_12565 [Solirubrobacteraceae bacterium]